MSVVSCVKCGQLMADEATLVAAGVIEDGYGQLCPKCGPLERWKEGPPDMNSPLDRYLFGIPSSLPAPDLISAPVGPNDRIAFVLKMPVVLYRVTGLVKQNHRRRAEAKRLRKVVTNATQNAR